MTRFRRCAALIALLLVAGAARAEPAAGPEQQAHAHFVAGQKAYAAGRWDEALREFELGYALSPRPEFLINFAQVHRKLGQYDRAIVECERYLSTSPPPDVRAGAERLLASLREEQARHEVTPDQPAPSAIRHPPSAAATDEAAAPEPTPTAKRTPVGPTPADKPAIVAPTPAPAPKRKAEGGRRKAWIAPVVIGAALVVAGAITLGIVLAPARDTFPSTPLGTVDFR